jgi:hypothetical protein
MNNKEEIHRITSRWFPFINKRRLEYTGLRFEEALCTDFEAMHPEGQPEFLAQWEHVFQNGTPSGTRRELKSSIPIANCACGFETTDVESILRYSRACSALGPGRHE